MTAIFTSAWYYQRRVCLSSLRLAVAGILVLFVVSNAGAQTNTDIPLAARVTLVKAGRLIETKDYEGAVTVLRQFQSKKEKEDTADRYGYEHAEIYYTLGVCYLLENKTAQAAEAFDKTLTKDPRHLSAMLNRAKAAYELVDYRKAAQCFQATYDLAPEKNPTHLYHAAVAWLLAKDGSRSLVIFERLLAEFPAQFELAWRENLVHAFIEAGKGRKALPHIRQLANEYTGEKQKKWQEVLLNQYLHLDMYKEALALASDLAEKDPGNPTWWRALVHINLYRNQYKPALTSLVILSYLEPLKDQEQRLLADLYLQLGVPTQATPVYCEILRNNPTARLLTNAVVALQMLGREEEAIRLIDEFKGKKLPQELQMQKADLLYRVGRYDKALQLYQVIAEEGGKEKKRAIQMAEYAKMQAGRG